MENRTLSENDSFYSYTYHNSGNNGTTDGQDLYYVVLAVHVVGVLLNIVAGVTFLSEGMSRYSCSRYLGAMAFADVGRSVLGICSWLSYSCVLHVIWHTVLCQGYEYGWRLGDTLSSWLIVAASVDRYICVALPEKARTICTVFRAKIVAIALTVLALMFNTFYGTFYVTSDQPHEHVCAVQTKVAESSYYQYFFKWFHSVYAFMIPSVVTLVFVILTAKNMINVRLCQHGEGLIQITLNEETTPTPRGSGASQDMPAGSANVARTVLVAAILKTAFIFPYTFCNWLYELDSPPFGEFEFKIVYHMYILDVVVCPMAYIVICRRFRRTLLRIFKNAITCSSCAQSGCCVLICRQRFTTSLERQFDMELGVRPDKENPEENKRFLAVPGSSSKQGILEDETSTTE